MVYALTVFRRELAAVECNGIAALAKGSVGPYQLQAAIGAIHDEAARVGDPDWSQILALYELLKRVSPGPMVSLNHAVATAMVHGPSKGLEQLQLLDNDNTIADHHRLNAVRAHLFEMLADSVNALIHYRIAYRIAASRTTSIPERNYLMTQVARLERESLSPPRI